MLHGTPRSPRPALDDMSLTLFAVFALFLAGTVKGAVGLGLPTTSLGILTLSVDPRTAIALTLVPMFISNLWQLYRAGEVWAAVRRYAPFVLSLMLLITVTLRLTADAPERLLLALLGLLMLAYVIVSITRWAPRIPARLDRSAQLLVGSVCGVLGGLVGIWAPPMAVYLAARQAGKDEFVRASGLILGLGSLPMILGYVREGFLSPPLLSTSVLLLLPTFAGFALGETLRDRLSEAAFRRMLLAFFAIAGLNLLRRALL